MAESIRGGSAGHLMATRAHCRTRQARKKGELTMTVTRSMAGKTVLITGGTGGIGRAAAIGLAAMGARVGITGRDRARADKAAAAIARESGNTAVDVFVADMSSQAEVRRLAGEGLDAY